MPYVITDPCIATCDTACVAACPVDAIHGEVPIDDIARARTAGRSLQLFIDPNDCICCAACVPECPASAIYDEDDVPPRWHSAIERNAAFFRR